MAEVRRQDVLLRIGGRTLLRTGSLCFSGSRRGEEFKESFARTCSRTYVDAGGFGRRATTGNLAIDWPSGLVDASGNAMGGPLVEGARTQVVTDPENFGNWTLNGTPIRTSGQADPFGGTAAYSINDDDGAAAEGISQTVTFTGDGNKTLALFIKAGTATNSMWRLRDDTAAAVRIQINVAWSAGVPTPSIVAGAGTIHNTRDFGGGWYRITFTANSIVAANTNTWLLWGATSTGSTTGSTLYYGANAWNVAFASGHQGPSMGTAAGDALTAPVNHGPIDLTVLARLARPAYADLSGALGISPGIFSIGAGSAARIGAYFDPAARNIVGVIDTATTDQTVSAAIPAGQPTVCLQFKNLTTGGQVAIDTGSGLSAFSSAATAFSAFSSQTMRVGRYDDELYGVIGDIIVAQGLRSYTEMTAIP